MSEANGRLAELTAVERMALRMLGRRLAVLADEVKNATGPEAWQVQAEAAADLCGIIEAAAAERDKALDSRQPQAAP